MNESVLELEMTKLTESVNGLEEAIKRQEKKISNYDKNLIKNIELTPNREFSEESRLGRTDSSITHWSWNVDSIHDTIDGINKSLRNQEKQILRLMTENDGTREEIKAKEKELEKQKEQLKNERETHEKLKRETCNEVKKRKSKESQVKDNINEKTSQELSKLNSELAIFKQMYLDQTHSLNSLSRRVSNMKDDNKNLKNKLLQQESRSHKYILEAAKRFDTKRKEFKELAKEKYAHETDHYRLVLYGIIEKNSSLAFDNSVLKFELDTLNQQLSEINSEESLTGSSNCTMSRPTTREGSRRISQRRFTSTENSKSNARSISPTRAKSHVSSSKTTEIIYSVDENPEKWLAWQKSSSNNLDHAHPRESVPEDPEVLPSRTYSAPELGCVVR